jgi:hypothetical protein
MRQVDRKGTPPMVNMRRMQGYPTLELVENEDANKAGVVAYEKRNGVVKEIKAQFLDGKKPEKDANRRAELARLVVESPNFPKATVNRMWSVFFGKGFCNPIDDFNEQNAVSNPELLAEVGEKFKHYNFDMKKLIRWIAHSNAYHLSYVANNTNDKPEHETLFSRMLMKSMTPEQLFESLMLATNSEAAESKDGKKQLKDKWLGALINNFGDDEGNEVNFNGTIVQALMMMNGKEINEAISRKDKGAVAVAMGADKSNRVNPAVITKLYLATLNRRPTKHEVTVIVTEMFPLVDAKVRAKDNERANMNNRYYDLFWALLNCNEFLLNH